MPEPIFGQYIGVKQLAEGKLTHFQSGDHKIRVTSEMLDKVEVDLACWQIGGKDGCDSANEAA